MKIEDPEFIDVAPFQELAAAVPPSTGTVDDDDDPAD
jgi:hypothetical protein